ncbi:MAG: leucine-rich repeat domain-containing protein [Alistipes sp.]|nr:leucine-rich repeat domain-containing protein [Alistipes senegalensis]MCM1249877.1 leucine-rich repeat domain-containing protein [Alistipes sp.]
MKHIRYITLILCVLGAVSCSNDEPVQFGLDENRIAIGADGGTRTVRISSGDDWIATTDAPWITVSPANGRGSVECRIIIDSALVETPRQGIVRIQNQQSWDNREITVDQDGYEYGISLEKPEVAVKNYATLDRRYFDVKVKTNIDFDVKLPDDAGWLKYDTYKVSLDRGIRPREVTVRFKWNISSIPFERIAEVEFAPKSDKPLARHDKLRVVQDAAAAIKENTREGDSVALLGIHRSLDVWGVQWNATESMTEWEGIVLWEESMEGCTPEKKGRVKSADFSFFSTKESLPFEVQYLTAAEELRFFSNSNMFLYSLDTGDAITKLTQLKRLTISGYGLTSLHPDFPKLENLEYLDLRSNNLQSIPEVISKEKLPKLRVLFLGTNQRQLVYDLSNSVQTDIGGLVDETVFPVELLAWDDLDTLSLSVNYLQGTLPTFEEDPSWPVYTQEDIDNSRNDKGVDTLPASMLGKPKVLPRTKFFAINLNRLSGSLPDWLLYHPALDWWIPYILIFNQEGRDAAGTTAGFDNEPVNLNYYYDFYPTKKRPTDEEEDE